MSAHFPDAETMRSALMLTVRAPSVHNSQPWQWRLGDRSLHLYANRALQLPHTDPDARDLILSCGAALNHCQIAFAALGWQAKIHRFPNPDEPDHLAALELHRHPAGDADIALAAAIPRRRTDRRRYSQWQIAPGDIALIGSRAARMGVTMRRVDDLPGLQKIVAEAAWQHAADHGYSAELAAWSGRYGAAAGVPARNTPKPDSRAPIPARWFAGPALAQPPGSEAEIDNAVVVALGTTEDNELSRLRAGEATSMVLLTATALGLASCPITEPLELAQTRDGVREHVFEDRNYPQMLLRMGWAPVNADPLPATPRRALSEVLVRLDGSPVG
ncbi:NAD(P)H nitroreductase [Mycobacterium sp. B14F4]|uniref:Acg family FMN-binding oxidoreductase n=1 Tax=Mycobacterium sp. B14F4 TaxID=3153565 RepID=UPI00325DB3AA